MQSKLAGLKEIVIKYNLKNFPINGDQEPVDGLVNHIFKENRSSVLEDAKKAIAVYNESLEGDVYFRYLTFAVNQNEINEKLGVLSTIPIKEAVECAHRLLKYTTLSLEDSLLDVKNEYDRNYVKSMLNAGIHLLEYLEVMDSPVDKTLLYSYKCLIKLQDEFGIYATLKEISSEEYCNELIESAVCAFLDKQHGFKR
ncbi:hypothetical protein X975_01978, partial [Stegodyphus mimosarum]